MERLYAVAELTWLKESEGGIRQPVQGNLSKPAVFEGDSSGSWWTLVIPLDEAVHPGDTITVPILPIIDEAARILLQKGRSFELKEGPRTIAVGRVTSVGTLDTQDGEPPLEALRRVGRPHRELGA